MQSSKGIKLCILVAGGAALLALSTQEAGLDGDLPLCCCVGGQQVGGWPQGPAPHRLAAPLPPLPLSHTWLLSPLLPSKGL